MHVSWHNNNTYLTEKYPILCFCFNVLGDKRLVLPLVLLINTYEHGLQLHSWSLVPTPSPAPESILFKYNILYTKWNYRTI